ncbi:MAG TPA: hypothetical protein VFC09_07200 [Candidatus Dormibacteraeota bacterium]|nr:hypothetical protein [Candidatus Dormibacteraeota bacterium]
MSRPNRPCLRTPLPPAPDPRPWDDAADERLRIYAHAVVDLAIRLRARRREMEGLTKGR